MTGDKDGLMKETKDDLMKLHTEMKEIVELYSILQFYMTYIRTSRDTVMIPITKPYTHS